jgi:CheY-like chemotaxis protein
MAGEEFVKISLSDNGPGIRDKDLEHIFDPFYTTKKMGKSGTGLGLTIVWNTVQEYKGWIEVKDNRPGAVFEIYLPAAPEYTAVSADASIGHQLQGNGEKILLIDDLPEQNETMEKMLVNMGYMPFSVGSGEEGIAFVQSQPVDLVLLDMIMGDGLNGRQTYERILEIYPGQKTIFLSGYSKNEDILKAKALGVSHFLEKPITRRKLGTAIKQVLSGK